MAESMIIREHRRGVPGAAGTSVDLGATKGKAVLRSSSGDRTWHHASEETHPKQSTRERGRSRQLKSLNSVHVITCSLVPTCANSSCTTSSIGEDCSVESQLLVDSCIRHVPKPRGEEEDCDEVQGLNQTLQEVALPDPGWARTPKRQSRQNRRFMSTGCRGACCKFELVPVETKQRYAAVANVSEPEESLRVGYQVDEHEDSHGEQSQDEPNVRSTTAQVGATNEDARATERSREVLPSSGLEEAATVMVHRADSEQATKGPFGSIGWSRASADDGSRRGRIRSSSEGHPLQPETQGSQGCSKVVDHDNGVNFGFVLGAKFKGPGKISVLTEKVKPGLSAIKRPDEWVEFEVTIDSGACVTVMPRDLCCSIGISPNHFTAQGVEYEVANGASIPNLGERRCEVMTIGSVVPKRIVFQVADVHKALLSITACADMGFDCYLGKEGGSLRDRVTGEVIPISRKDNLYTMRMWVRQDPSADTGQGFGGQGR